MRWLKTNLQSIHGLLGPSGRQVQSAARSRTESARQAMLDAMTDAGLDELYRPVVERIRYADGIEALWYVRSDMMTALAAERGEAYARRKLDALSRLFEAVLPTGLGSIELRRRS